MTWAGTGQQKRCEAAVMGQNPHGSQDNAEALLDGTDDPRQSRGLGQGSSLQHRVPAIACDQIRRYRGYYLFIDCVSNFHFLDNGVVPVSRRVVVSPNIDTDLRPIFYLPSGPLDLSCYAPGCVTPLLCRVFSGREERSRDRNSSITETTARQHRETRKFLESKTSSRRYPVRNERSHVTQHRKMRVEHHLMNITVAARGSPSNTALRPFKRTCLSFLPRIQ
ncbi:hypothetical protein J6590_000199 [Homalodisca vitripennis]|nr:hypothetical protein J6590_000199 [Homalodisca vitripennis]